MVRGRSNCGPGSNANGERGGDKDGSSGAPDAPAARRPLRGRCGPGPRPVHLPLHGSGHEPRPPHCGHAPCLPPCRFPLAGRATFPGGATSAATLAKGPFRTGFSSYLLTTEHVPITGPCMFYMPEDVASGGEAESVGLYGMSMF
jgi:hypothetical protein